MYDQLTPSDIKKMQEEIEHRKLVDRRNPAWKPRTGRNSWPVSGTPS